MTIEQGATEADVKIRVPRTWVGYMNFVTGGAWLVIAAVSGPMGRPWVALFGLVIGCLNVGLGLALRFFGIDLTPGFAVVRCLRRRRVPWGEVQAVVSNDGKYGTSVVRLILDNGESVRLPLSKNHWRKGNAQCERDFHRMVQWWITHRGESWRPVHPETPQPSVSGERDWQPAQLDRDGHFDRLPPHQHHGDGCRLALMLSAITARFRPSVTVHRRAHSLWCCPQLHVLA
jgi:hypothetical protein